MMGAGGGEISGAHPLLLGRDDRLLLPAQGAMATACRLPCAWAVAGLWPATDRSRYRSQSAGRFTVGLNFGLS